LPYKFFASPALHELGWLSVKDHVNLRDNTLACRWKFPPPCYYQSKNFSPFLVTNSGHVGGDFHQHFSVVVEKWYAISPMAKTQWQVTINVKGKHLTLLYRPFYWVMTILLH